VKSVQPFFRLFLHVVLLFLTQESDVSPTYCGSIVILLRLFLSI